MCLLLQTCVLRNSSAPSCLGVDQPCGQAPLEFAYLSPCRCQRKSWLECHRASLPDYYGR